MTADETAGTPLPLPELPEGVAVAPEEVVFASGTRHLKGYLYLPPGEAPFACVLDNHGSQTRPRTWDVARPQTAAAMLAWGYAFFFPHRAGYGNSPGTPLSAAVSAPPGTPEHDDQLTRRLGPECDDVIAALDYLCGRPEVDAARIAVMGNSRGGILSLLAAARDRRFRCAVDFSGGASQWAGHPKLRTMMREAARRLSQPVFLIQAANDIDTRPTTELAADLKRAGKAFRAEIFPRWGHTAMEGHLFATHGAAVWGPHVHAFLARCFS